MNLSSQKSAIALSASAAALLMPVSAFAEDGAAGADILIPKMAEFIPALIAFLIIWIVLAKVALPGIMKTMEERGKKIEESLDEAEKTKQEAIAKRAESDSIVTDARRQAAGACIGLENPVLHAAVRHSGYLLPGCSAR